MRIVSDNLEEIDDIKTAIALGTFDGIHKGHRRIIELAREYSGDRPVMVYAFENLPSSYFGSTDKAILSYSEKLYVMGTLDIDFLTMIKFDDHIMNMAAVDFLDYIHYELDGEVISCGFNYSFGKNAEGTPDFLKSYCKERNLVAIVAEPVMCNGHPVSSTRIRRALLEGDIPSANEMLSYQYFFSGKVHNGKHLGRQLGFPTANLLFPPEKLVPRKGVYATHTVIDGVDYPSMTNIGVRPTVENTSSSNAETYIIGYTGDIYDREITVYFSKYMREEHRFENVSQLKQQLEQDREIALQTHFAMLK